VTTKEFSKFRNRRHILPGEKFANHVFFISDDHWKHVRHSIAPVFSTGKLKQVNQEIQGWHRHLLASLYLKYKYKNWRAAGARD